MIDIANLLSMTKFFGDNFGYEKIYQYHAEHFMYQENGRYHFLNQNMIHKEKLMIILKTKNLEVGWKKT